MNRLVRIALAVALALAVAGVAAVPLPAAPAPDGKEKPAAKTIDVVICLDVSGSMNGLIDSAKAKLWDIVNDLAKAQPTPQLRVGNHHKVPALAVRAAGRLCGDLQAALNHLWLDRAREIEPLAHRACRRQQVVDHIEIHLSPLWLALRKNMRNPYDTTHAPE